MIKLDNCHVVLVAMNNVGVDADEGDIRRWVKMHFGDVSDELTSKVISLAKEKGNGPTRVQVMREKALELLANPIGVEQLRLLITSDETGHLRPDFMSNPSKKITVSAVIEIDDDPKVIEFSAQTVDPE